MLSQPRRWWIGLVVPALLFALAVPPALDPIEQDLTSRVDSTLTASGYDWARVVAGRGRDLALEGSAPDGGSLGAAGSVAERVDGVRLVDRSALKLLPEVKPYAFTAERRDGRLLLEGSIPSTAIRRMILARIAEIGTGGEIVDRMAPARGAPAGFAAAIETGLSELLRLESGRLTISDNAVSLAGQAADFGVLAAVPAALRTLPAGFVLGKVDLRPPRVSPFVWTATLRPAELALEGFVPAEGVKAALAARARELFPALRLNDSTRVAEGAPAADWPAAATLALSRLARLVEGRASLSDGVFSLSGTQRLGTDDDAAAIALPRGFTAGEIALRPPQVSPYVLTVARTAEGVSLSGFAPDAQARQRAEGEARARIALPLESRLQVAAGLPAGVDYASAVAFMLRTLAGFEQGEAALVDRGVSFTGRIADQANYDRVLADLRGSLPAGLVLRGENISFVAPPAPPPAATPDPAAAAPAAPDQPVSPYTWQASRRDGQVTLSGHVPDDKSRREILALVARLFQGDRVEDRAGEAIGAPRSFMAGVTAALEQLARLDDGEAAIADETLRLKGQALLAPALESVRQGVTQGLPQGWRGEAEVALQPPAPPVDAARCQALLTGLMRGRRIYFRSGSDEIDTDAAGLLDRLTATVRRCPDARIEVEGHTDADGSAAFNQDLSERRAFAVVNYMIRNGNIDSQRLRAVGFGMSRPLASNDSEDGKARNRRIEFVVR